MFSTNPKGLKASDTCGHTGNMQQYHILKKEYLNNFIISLSKDQKVAAPVKRGDNQYTFEFINSGEEISLNHLPTILPPKKYFFPLAEVLANYDLAFGQELKPLVEYEKMTIFGVHTCDLAGIQCLNMAFSERPRDYNYLIRKNKITIIGYECNSYCDKNAGCRLVHNHFPNGGYDLFFTDLGDYFAVHVNTRSGEDIVEITNVFENAERSHILELKKFHERKKKIFEKNEVSIEHEKISELFSKSYNHPIWGELNKRCLACGNCTTVCPTCYCFDIADEPNLDLKTGIRYRKWDSCQNEGFAKVAGGESFRKERGSRQRHRYYRKFRYPIERFSRFFCTGCGRCTRSCMAGIKLKEILNTLIADYNKNEDVNNKGI